MINILEEDFKELLSLLKEIEKSTIGVQYNKLFNTIWFQNIDELDLYIRGSVSGYLTIARICLTDKHCGNGTKILEIVKKIAKLKGFKGVEIESTTTKEINKFCEKYGFKKHQYSGMEIDGEWYGNYRLDII